MMFAAANDRNMTIHNIIDDSQQLDLDVAANSCACPASFMEDKHFFRLPPALHLLINCVTHETFELFFRDLTNVSKCLAWKCR